MDIILLNINLLQKLNIPKALFTLSAIEERR
jgi:hypothetical protein